MANRRATYHIKYKMHESGRECGIDIVAGNKAEAWERAVFEAIPARDGSCPFSAWLHSVTYGNGNRRIFKNFEGLPY